MSIKVTVEERSDETVWKFPCLAKAKNSGRLVYVICKTKLGDSLQWAKVDVLYFGDTETFNAFQDDYEPATPGTRVTLEQE